MLNTKSLLPEEPVTTSILAIHFRAIHLGDSSDVLVRDESIGVLASRVLVLCRNQDSCPHSRLPRMHVTAAQFSPLKIRLPAMVASPRAYRLAAHRLARAGSDLPPNLSARQVKVRHPTALLISETSQSVLCCLCAVRGKQ